MIENKNYNRDFIRLISLSLLYSYKNYSKKFFKTWLLMDCRIFFWRI